MFVVYRKGRFETFPYGYTTTKPYNNQGRFNAVLFLLKNFCALRNNCIFAKKKDWKNVKYWHG